MSKWLALLCVIPLIAGAAEKKRRPNLKRSQGLFRMENVPHKHPNYRIFSVSFIGWQEGMVLNRGSDDSKLQAQLKGVVLSFDFNRPGAGSWQTYYGFEVGAGTVKGIGVEPIADQFAQQPWISATFKPGLIWRSSPAARAGIFVPAVYRHIQWAYDKSSETKVTEPKFSVGIGALYVARLTRSWSFLAAVAYQHMWATSVWQAGWGYEF